MLLLLLLGAAAIEATQKVNWTLEEFKSYNDRYFGVSQIDNVMN